MLTFRNKENKGNYKKVRKSKIGSKEIVENEYECHAFMHSCSHAFLFEYKSQFII